MADAARLKAELVCYQQVNTVLLRHQVLIPLRFGCTASNTAQSQEVLTKVYLHLRAIPNRLHDQGELVVQILWNLPALLQSPRRALRPLPRCVPAERLQDVS